MDQLAERKIHTVYEITAEIKQTLEKFGVLWVKGEISNFKHHSSGHMYFSLKDDRAQLKAAFFRNNNYYLKFRPEDGLEVLVRGRISVYEPRGDYQILVEYMEPVGVGSLQLAFEQLKQKLRNEGLFDEAHKVRLPLLPRKIGIVTSPTGAAIRDMLRILNRRNASLDILIFPARVQGTGAAEEIAAGVRYFNARDDIDVIIVARGGGSMEDLWAFNEEIVARAIYASQIPVISAVGHEVDFTIADFVADLRAPTPSAAAEMVSGAREDLLATVRSLSLRALQAVRLLMERRRSALERLARNRAFNVAPNKVRELQQRFDESTLKMTQTMARHLTALRHRERVLQMRLIKVDLRQTIARNAEILAGKRNRLQSAARTWLQSRRSKLELEAGRMNALSPLAILQRGYAICRSQRGVILRDVAGIVRGERVEVKLARGELGCRVEETKS
ncbi:MAG: exodeoxyribonuclease VII large subunit [Acidobacteriia bacterium]|nr:exodeoxyribonuclease VII large subunit [Terriglobia bacterium]